MQAIFVSKRFRRLIALSNDIISAKIYIIYYNEYIQSIFVSTPFIRFITLSNDIISAKKYIIYYSAYMQAIFVSKPFRLLALSNDISAKTLIYTRWFKYDRD